MPDYSTNLLTVTGDSDALEVFIDRAKGAKHEYRDNRTDDESVIEPLSFHALDPVPEALLKLNYNEGGYDWELKHWGVKWGTDEVEVQIVNPNEIQYLFTTPNGVPVRFIRKVSTDFPDLRFQLIWIMPGVDSYGGGVWKSGKILEEWERETTDDQTQRVEMAWEGEISMFDVMRNLDDE